MTGRPRDLELHQRLLAAGWSLLTSDGYHALTLSKVASRAGAHRSDVYRRWPTKAQLVVDVLDEHLPRISEPDTGSLASDLRAIVEDFAASWSSPWIDGLLGLTADLQRDPTAELAFQKVAERRGAPMARCIERAIDRGEIEHTPGGLVMDLIEGPLMHRRMIGRRPLTPDYLDAVAQYAHRLLTGTGVER